MSELAGSRVGGRVYYLTAILSLIAACVEQPLLDTAPKLTISGRSMIHGDNDRVEYGALSGALKLWADATAAVMGNVNVQCPPGVSTCSLVTFPFNHVEGGEICADDPLKGQPAAASCTAFLVSPNYIMTAAHCIDPSIAPLVRVVFGFVVNAQGNYPTSALASDVYRVSGVESWVREVGQDFAIARLDRPVTDRQPLNLAHAPAAPAGDIGVRLMMTGHPAGLPLKAVTAGSMTG